MTGVIGAPSVSLNVTQGFDSLDTGAVIYPTPEGYFTNPNPVTLAELTQVWGRRRDTWTKQPATYMGTTSANASWYVPVTVTHRQATALNDIPAALHFIHTGQAFGVLFAGNNPQITVVANGEYCSNGYITTALTNGIAGAVLSEYSTFVRFDFGSRATRRISVYGYSTQGAAALAIGPQDTMVPWDRSAEPSFCAMTDSYGQGSGINWYFGGPFWEAAVLLGIPHLDLNAMGATGYAPTQTAYSYTAMSGNAFPARIPDSVVASPDLFFTAGGINDDYGIASPPLYPTANAATAAFTAAVNNYYQTLRAALPNSVIAAMGPWAPRQSIPTNPLAQAKLNVIQTALQSISGPWVLIDNLNGGWLNSSNATGAQTGPWQTGTGNVTAPKGDGNGDIYLSADGTHPTVAGNMYLARQLASNLAAAILAL
jgi:lysophospholipase L1-like esterase